MTIFTFVILTLNFLGQVFLELSKEKSSLKQAENHTQTFLKTLGSVENKLTDQINYLTQVSTGQPHEGSGYASQKVLQMAWHRLEHARSRVNELEKIKFKHMQGNFLGCYNICNHFDFYLRSYCSISTFTHTTVTNRVQHFNECATNSVSIYLTVDRDV